MSKKALSDMGKNPAKQSRHYITLSDAEFEGAKKKYGVQKVKELKAKFLG